MQTKKPESALLVVTEAIPVSAWLSNILSPRAKTLPKWVVLFEIVQKLEAQHMLPTPGAFKIEYTSADDFNLYEPDPK